MTRRTTTVLAAAITLMGGLSLATSRASAQEVIPDRGESCCNVGNGPRCCGTEYCWATPTECGARDLP